VRHRDPWSRNGPTHPGARDSLRRIVQSLLEAPEFGAAVVFGLLALAAVGLTGFVWRRATDGGAVPGAGLVIAGATLLALSRVGRVSTWLLVGLGAVVAGSAIRAWLRVSPLWTALLVAPGAAVIAHLALPGPGWIRHVAFVGIAMGGGLAAAYGRDGEGDQVGPLLISVSAAGIWATVPDTEHALALLGASAPLAVAGWPLRWARLGAVGAPTWVALAMWTVASGGVGRSTAVVGGVGSLGVLALEPALWTLARRKAPAASAPMVRPVEELGLHLALVLISSRIAGLRRSLPVAIGIVVAAYSGAAWLLLVARSGAPGTFGREPPAS